MGMGIPIDARTPRDAWRCHLNELHEGKSSTPSLNNQDLLEPFQFDCLNFLALLSQRDSSWKNVLRTAAGVRVRDSVGAARARDRAPRVHAPQSTSTHSPSASRNNHNTVQYNGMFENAMLSVRQRSRHAFFLVWLVWWLAILETQCLDSFSKTFLLFYLQQFPDWLELGSHKRVKRQPTTLHPDRR